MARQTKGNLTITSVKDDNARLRAAHVLAEAEGRQPADMAAQLASLPYELGRNVNEEDAADIIRFLRGMGVTARFSPQMDEKLHKQAQKAASPRPSRPEPTAAPGGSIDFRSGSPGSKPARAAAKTGAGLGGMDFRSGSSKGKPAPSRPQRSAPKGSGGGVDFRSGAKGAKGKGRNGSSALEILFVPGLLFLLAAALWAYIAFVKPIALVAG